MLTEHVLEDLLDVLGAEAAINLINHSPTFAPIGVAKVLDLLVIRVQHAKVGVLDTNITIPHDNKARLPVLKRRWPSQLLSTKYTVFA